MQEVGKEQKPQIELETELARVRRELAEVKMERDLLKKNRDVLRDRVAVRYGVIEPMRQDYPHRWANAWCFGQRLLRLAQTLALETGNARLEAEILAAHQRARESFRPERLRKHFERHGIHVGVCRIKRLRRKLGLRCRQKRKFKATTNSRHDLPVAPHLLQQDFDVPAPNQP